MTKDDAVCIATDPTSAKKHIQSYYHDGAVSQVKWRPRDSHTLASSCHKKLCIWDTRSNEQTSSHSTRGKIHTVAWSPDGTKLACGVEVRVGVGCGLWVSVGSDEWMNPEIAILTLLSSQMDKNDVVSVIDYRTMTETTSFSTHHVVSGGQGGVGSE